MLIFVSVRVCVCTYVCAHVCLFTTESVVVYILPPEDFVSQGKNTETCFGPTWQVISYLSVSLVDFSSSCNRKSRFNHVASFHKTFGSYIVNWFRISPRRYCSIGYWLLILFQKGTKVIVNGKTVTCTEWPRLCGGFSFFLFFRSSFLSDYNRKCFIE